METNVDLRKMSSEFLAGIPLEMNYVRFQEEETEHLEVLTSRVLRFVSLEYLQEIVFTVISELIQNSLKANAKRMLFQMEGLDIRNPGDYAIGMKEFRENFFAKQNEIFKNLQNSDLNATLTLRNLEDHIQIVVTNNSELLPEEEKRIREKISNAKKFKTLNEAYESAMDSEESMGLGIVLVHLLLKNSNVKADFLTVETNNKETKFQILLPKNLFSVSESLQIRKKLIDAVDSLPHIPRSIENLIQLAKEKDVNLNLLALEIEKDPAIATEVLKLANSPLFVGYNPIDDILSGIKRVGLGVLTGIFLSYGIRQVWNSNEPENRRVWLHGIRSSFVAKVLAQQNPNFSQNYGMILLCGLLHDLGKMILLSLDLSQWKEIQNFRLSSFPDSFEKIEEHMLGLSHSEIAYLFFVKWNFPPSISEVIRYHHKPWLCDPNFAAICEIIYMSDHLSHAFSGHSLYHHLEPEIAKKFGIFNSTDYDTLLLNLTKEYALKKSELESIFAT